MEDEVCESDVEFSERLNYYFKCYRFSKELNSYAPKYIFTFFLKQEKLKANYHKTTGKCLLIFSTEVA
jgi:hypothetical protein